MQTANEHGVYQAENIEEIARHERSYGIVEICHCEDGFYRYGVSLLYSYGGTASPITKNAKGYASYSAAKDAGGKELLQRFPTLWLSDPQSVHNELKIMREQIELYFRQPTLF